MPTFSPGCTRVPRWRIRMLPAETCSPPKRLTPSLLAWESRPLRELPPAFLCAMSYSFKCGAGLLALDARDLDFRIRLPMALVLLVVLAPAHLENLHLVAAPVREDFRFHARSGKKR